MKTKALVPKSLTYPPIFRAVTSSKRRKLAFRYPYCTSSKPATDNLPAKLNIFNWRSTSNNFLPVIWKSVAAANSFLNNITSHFNQIKSASLSKTEKHDTELKTNSSDLKFSTTIVNYQKFISDDSNVTDTKLGAEKKHNVPAKKKDQDLEQTFFEWLAGSDLRTKRKEFLEKDDKKVDTIKKTVISKSSLQQRSRFLVSSLMEASSAGSQLLRLEEICKHLLLYPEQKAIMCKAGLVKSALLLKNDFSDKAVQEQARCALALVGYHDPPKGEGIRILSIDGGGTRGIMSIEILRQLEAKTNKKFMNYLISYAVKLSNEIFKQSTIWGTGRLVWSHAYYDTTAWVNVLKKTFGDTLIIDTAKNKDIPKIAVVSALLNLPHLEAFVFRNYDYPPRIQSYYKGTCKYRMWESIRASGAAPGYFEEYCLDDYLHQDGGILVNNPTALGIHEAKLLWPSDPIQCVMSLGSGRYIPQVASAVTYTSLKTKILKVIDSATDTEAVHIIVNDLLSPYTYFRFNPYLTEFLTLDENREEKLDQMKRDAQMYLRRNEYKFASAAAALSIKRNYLRHAKDWMRVQRI
ncbi:calcium-independent phospholipase A2-gamma [Caerostris darwini]|uniref:Calcium-independent phospholipase A2-gamma n=1 Tax=Caerostris darwini TaxID=1538125 RepID=A0AAV4PF41_9ARAC|nr:calcium-independent phospholipase A2-gamma [Caerostris darwini]